MNWLVLLQLLSTLTPEILALIAAIAKAVENAPPEHQAAVLEASGVVQMKTAKKVAQ